MIRNKDSCKAMTEVFKSEIKMLRSNLAEKTFNIPVNDSYYFYLEYFADFLLFLGFWDLSDMSETGEWLRSDRKDGGPHR